MAYQETVTTGYGTQVKQSFKKVATGFTLFLGATAMLWWNEGNSVKTADMLVEAQGVCVEMENPDKKDASLEGQLVCGTAMTATTDLLTDKDFGFSANAISMKRKVEYFQWDEKRTEETKQKLDGSEKKIVTYDYNLVWSSTPIGSKNFKEHSTHVNTVLAKFEDDDPISAKSFSVRFGRERSNFCPRFKILKIKAKFSPPSLLSKRAMSSIIGA